MRGGHIQYIIDNYSDHLQKRLLREGIDISVDQAIDTFLTCDPSQGKKLTDWLVKTYCSGGFLWQDVEIGAASKLAEVLNMYRTHFNQISRDQRDIYLYRSYGELYRLVEPYIVVPSEDTSVGSREIKRRERAKALEESKVLHRSDECIIAVPLTKEASQWWGKGTKWCTAAENNNYFNHYNEDAPLIVILINDYLSGINSKKRQETEKFQLWTFNDEVQFMNASDSEIDSERIEKYWHYFEPVFKVLVKENSCIFKFIPEKFRTEELNRSAVENNGSTLRHIPGDQQSAEICKLAVQHTWLAIQYVCDTFFTDDICRLAVEQNGGALGYIPQKFRTEELCKLAVEQNGSSLCHVPESFRTLEICKKAVEQFGLAILLVRDEFITAELCRIAVNQAGKAIRYIPSEHMSPELCRLAIENNEQAFKEIPEKYKDYELCKFAVEKYGRLVSFVPKQFLTLELVCKALQTYGLAIYFIPDEHKTKELCMQAVEKDSYALRCIPDHLKTNDICRLAVQKQGATIVYILDRFKTPELCRLAIENNHKAMCYVPEKFKTYELLAIVKKENDKKPLQERKWSLAILDDLKDHLNKHFYNAAPHGLEIKLG